MTLHSLPVAVRDTDVMLPLLCSLFAGALIRAERELHGKPAGVRTHTLVCFASALMTLLGLRMEEWTAALPANAQIVTDMARMPHAILTGIGFPGAGVIFHDGATVQGLTTAASLWLTAVLGIVFGTGLLEVATIGTCQRRSKIGPRGGAKLGHFGLARNACGGRRPVSRALHVAGG